MAFTKRFLTLDQNNDNTVNSIAAETADSTLVSVTFFHRRSSANAGTVTVRLYINSIPIITVSAENFTIVDGLENPTVEGFPKDKYGKTYIPLKTGDVISYSVGDSYDGNLGNTLGNNEYVYITLITTDEPPSIT